MNSALVLGLFLCATIVGLLLKGRTRLYYFTCTMFLIGAFGAGLGLMDGIRGNHWEISGGRYSRSWYQNIGVGLILMCGAIYIAHRGRAKSRTPDQQHKPTSSSWRRGM